jgi:hypothetical protein
MTHLLKPETLQLAGGDVGKTSAEALARDSACWH